MGVIQGYPDGNIKPDNNITRAEAVTALMKSIGYGLAPNPEFTFADKNEIPNWVILNYTFISQIKCIIYQ